MELRPSRHEGGVPVSKAACLILDSAEVTEHTERSESHVLLLLPEGKQGPMDRRTGPSSQGQVSSGRKKECQHPSALHTHYATAAQQLM